MQVMRLFPFVAVTCYEEQTVSNQYKVYNLYCSFIVVKDEMYIILDIIRNTVYS